MLSFFTKLFSAPKPAHDPLEGAHPQWLVVGLGNPGAKYAATRHNVGYMALDQLLDGTELQPVPGMKVQAWVDGEVAYARSTTYMNLSGEGIAPLAQRFGIAPDHVIAMHDELDLQPGAVRLKLGGNENGHNGLKSLTEHLGTREYLRVRMGIGRPTGGETIPDWVLGTLDAGAELDRQVALAGKGARLIVAEGLAKAQNVIHSRG